MAILSNINGKFAVDSTGAIQFNGQAGTSGYIAPTWVAASTVIGGPYLPLTGGTLTGATATASGISFTVGGDLTVGDDINISGEQLTFTNDSASAYIRAADALLIQSDWNTGENKPIYLQPSASTFAGSVDVTSGASYGSGLQISRTSHPSLSIITGGTSNAYIGIAPSGGTYIDAITISNTGNTTFAGNVVVDDSLGVGVSPGTFYPGNHNLVVGDGNADSAVTVYSNSANTGYLLFADGTSGSSSYTAQVRYNHSTNHMEFATNNSTTAKMTLDDNGNGLCFC